MASYPPLKLSRLRDIGWTEWDPIGILAKGEIWDHHPAADEYDSYLLQVASRLRRDWSVADATEFLIWVASEHMGLSAAATTSARSRAEATAKAIKAYLETLPADP
jgi:hypothetical protein